MDNRKIAFIILSLIIICIIILSAFYFPMSRQEMMYPYDNEWKEGEIGFKTHVKCPVDSSTEDTEIIGTVEELRQDPNVHGERINLILICKCEKHHIVWSQF